MKKICVLLLSLALVSCSTETADPLSYQDGEFSVKARIASEDDTFTALISSTSTENGREATLTIRDGILDGLTFVFGEGTCIMNGRIRIQLDDPRLVMGAYEIVSMFQIDRESFHGTSEAANGEVFIFTDSEENSKYEVLLVDSMPKRIRAMLGDRVIIAEIDEFLSG